VNERELLMRLIAGPVSGDVLARESGQTRAAIWKNIETLRASGVQIDAQAGRGYVLQQHVDLLDGVAIANALPDGVRTQLASLDIAWTLDSTSSALLRAKTPDDGAAVLLAEHQTGGRGRRGRIWTSPLAANLYLSVARYFSGGLTRLGGLSLVAGVALAEALHAIGYTGTRLKWPNDVLIGTRKLGGILIEGGGEHAGPVRAVIGIGLNVRMPRAVSADIDQPWIDLAVIDAPLQSRNALASCVLMHLLPALETFDRDGLAPFLPRYAAMDGLAGRNITVQAGDGLHVGMALGVADDGALRVGLANGERIFHSGDVSVRPH